MTRTTIKIQEDCMSPSRWIFLDYRGKNPFSVANKIAGMLLPFFEVSSAGVSETDFRWDTSGDPIEFYFTWWVDRAKSRYSRQRFDIKVSGNQKKETKEGSFTLQVHGTLATMFESSNPFAKAIFWVYDYIFYNRRRAEYLRNCEETIYDFRDEIKKHFNLQVLEKG